MSLGDKVCPILACSALASSNMESFCSSRCWTSRGQEIHTCLCGEKKHSVNQMKIEASSGFLHCLRSTRMGSPPLFVSLAVFWRWAEGCTQDGGQIRKVLLDPLGCDLARKCEIIIRTDCLEVEGNKQTSNTFLKEKAVC